MQEVSGKSKANVLMISANELIFEIEYPNLTMKMTYKKAD